MNTIEINAFSRESCGKKSTNKIRKEGNVPCVLYRGKENLHFYAPEKSFRGLIYTPQVYLINLVVDGKSYQAVLKDSQFHPVSDHLLHLDFMQVSEDKPITIAIPLMITGDSVGVKAGGKLRIKRRSLTVKGLIKDIPNHFTIDVTNLGIGSALRVRDLHFDNLELVDNKRAMIISVDVSRIALKDEEAAEEGEEETADEGETPAEE